ncbi:hypothetical protein BH10PSE19_BH10PSE19_10590 [soil metagenome]
MLKTGAHIIQPARAFSSEVRKVLRIPQATFFTVVALFSMVKTFIAGTSVTGISIAEMLLGYPLVGLLWLDIIPDLIAIFKDRNFHYGKLGQLILNLTKASLFTAGFILGSPLLMMVGIGLRAVYDFARCLYHLFKCNDPITGGLHWREFKQYSLRLLIGVAMILGCASILFPGFGLPVMAIFAMGLAITALNSWHTWQLSAPHDKRKMLIVAIIRTIGAVIVGLSLQLGWTFGVKAMTLFFTAAAGPYFPLFLLAVAAVIAIVKLVKTYQMPLSQLPTDRIALATQQDTLAASSVTITATPKTAPTQKWDAYKTPIFSELSSPLMIPAWKVSDNMDSKAFNIRLEQCRTSVKRWRENLYARLAQLTATGEPPLPQMSCWATVFPDRKQIKHNQYEMLSHLKGLLEDQKEFVKNFNAFESDIRLYEHTFKDPTQALGLAEACFLETQAFANKVKLTLKLQACLENPAQFPELEADYEKGKFSNGFQTSTDGGAAAAIDEVFRQWQHQQSKDATPLAAVSTPTMRAIA